MSERLVYVVAYAAIALACVALLASLKFANTPPTPTPEPAPVPPCLVPGGGTPDVPTPA